jgi:thiol:disulfide interchange protein
MKKSILRTLMIVLMTPLSIQSLFSQNVAHDYLRTIAKTYLETQVLSFDGNIKYYTGIANTSPQETSLMSYRRDGNKVQIVIGDQTIVYDGKLNVVINEDQKLMYVSSKKAETKKGILPTGSFEDYINSGEFNITAADYVGNKRKVSIASAKKASASTMEFIYQPNTNFIEFSRMIIDTENEEIDEEVNKKKFEFSYYNYKTKLDEKIDASKYVTTVKSGKKVQYKGVGKYKDFEIVVI